MQKQTIINAFYDTIMFMLHNKSQRHEHMFDSVLFKMGEIPPSILLSSLSLLASTCLSVYLTSSLVYVRILPV